MKLKILPFILSILIGFSIPVSAQIFNNDDEDCAVSYKKIEKQPWFGNNQFLFDVLDSCNYFASKTSYEKALFRVPVKFWVYRNSDKTGGISAQELKVIMENLNAHNIKNNTGFLYYLREIKYVNKTRHTIWGYYFEGFTQSLLRHTKGCINVHITEDIVKHKLFKKNSRVKGTYNKISKAVYPKRVSSSSSLAHEIAHYFGLLHTHQDYNKGKCRQEAVDRNRRFEDCRKSGLICEHNGDKLCDTPAEPNLKGITNNNCEYTGDAKYILKKKNFTALAEKNVAETTIQKLEVLNSKPYKTEAGFIADFKELLSEKEFAENKTLILKYAENKVVLTDNWGDVYQPDVRNIMAYTKNRECRDVFTLEQIGVMVHTAKKQGVYAWDTRSVAINEYKEQYYFDSFEPDNTLEMASEIAIGNSQNHTFHKVYLRENKDDADNDVDWLKFSVKSAQSGKISIATTKGEFKNADTELFLYNSDGKQLATDDNSNTDNFSKITVPNLESGWYYIKVVKKNTIENLNIADYKILVELAN